MKKPDSNGKAVGQPLLPLQTQLEKQAEMEEQAYIIPYMKKIMTMPKNDALELLEEYVLDQFNVIYGTRLIELDMSVDQLEADIMGAVKNVEACEQALSKIERTVKRASSGEERSPVLSARLYVDGQMNWTFLRDGGIVVCALGGMGLLLAMASLNVFSNLMNSGSMVFIEHPWIAASLSVLPAVSSFSVKYFGQLLPEKYHKHYSLILHGMAVISLLVWCLTFGYQFHNNAGGEFDLDAVGTSAAPDFGVAYTISQLLTEVLVSACLFVTVEDIYQKYANDTLVENPTYTVVLQHYQEAKNTLKELQNKRKADLGELKTLNAKRKIFVSENMATFLNLIS